MLNFWASFDVPPIVLVYTMIQKNMSYLYRQLYNIYFVLFNLYLLFQIRKINNIKDKHNRRIIFGRSVTASDSVA